jgi:mRNA interferase HicA
MRKRKLGRWLHEHGAQFERHGRDHDIWRGPRGGQATVPRHRDINSLTARGICDQLGVPRPPWR